MEYLGKITDPKDLTTKEYVDNGVSGVQTSLTTHINDKENPHNVTKGQVGLSNVDNIKQWSTNNHPTTLSGYGITDAATSSQLSALTTRVNTNEDNIAMAETDIESLQGDVGTLKTDMTTVKGAVTTLQDTYVPNTRKINGKALSADVTLTASDVGALPSTTQIPTKTSDLDNDSGFITSAPVTSVNSKTGAVTLTAADIGMGDTTNIIYGEDAVNIEATTPINADTLQGHGANYFVSQTEFGSLANVARSGSYNDLSNTPSQDQLRAIYVGTADPASSLGVNGDIYIKYSG